MGVVGATGGREISRRMVSGRAFFDVSALLFAASPAVIETIHADEPLAGPKRYQSVGHRSLDGAERSPGLRHPLVAAPDASRVVQTSATLQWDVRCECRSRRSVLSNRLFLASGLACRHGDRCKSPA